MRLFTFVFVDALSDAVSAMLLAALQMLFETMRQWDKVPTSAHAIALVDFFLIGFNGLYYMERVVESTGRNKGLSKEMKEMNLIDRYPASHWKHNVPLPAYPTSHWKHNVPLPAYPTSHWKHNLPLPAYPTSHWKHNVPLPAYPTSHWKHNVPLPAYPTSH
jgi:hypothetical protein